MLEELKSWAGRKGWQVGWGPVEAIDAAVADVASRGISAAVAEYASESVSGEDALDLRARGLPTVVVVVMPRPAHAVLFEVEGEAPFQALLPPTYLRYRNLFDEVRKELEVEALRGARVETLRAPLKQLAARLGLVRYGRNNLAYAPGAGSYVQLLGYVTDAHLPLPAAWKAAEPALLARCATCRACLNSCPADAIREDRVLLDADRCLTFANEQPGAWPSWIGSGAHHALIGCLRCQSRCPENPRLAVEPAGAAFDREETTALLTEPEDRTAPAWAGVRTKLELMGQLHAEDVVGRNLRALLGRRGANAS